MQQSNFLKKIAIVDAASDWVKIEGGRLNKETLQQQVKYFDKASGLLDYLNTLKRTHKLDRFPDYVLIDMHLPDMDAATFLDRFELVIEKIETPEVFILSSIGTKKNRDLAMQYSFVSAYLEKPVPSDLIEVLIAGKGVDDSPQ